jgi:hypothetical protein
MSENKGSFWSSVPGLVTGLAGVLTAVVGLITVLIQLNVIGGDNDSGHTVAAGGSATTTVAGATQGTVPAGGTTPTTEAGRLTVDPTSLTLKPGEHDKAIKVINPTRTATVTVLSPEITGTDKAVFQADAGCTSVKLGPGDTCTLKVLFAPSGPLRSYNATLVVKGDRGTPPTNVPIQASTIL